MHRLLNLVRRYLSGLERHGRWAFLWRTWIHAVVISYAAASLTQLVVPAGPRTDLMRLPALELCLLVLAIGPFTETLLFQFLPLEVARAAAVRRWLRFAISIVPFAFMHLFVGLSTVVAAGFVGGFFFAFTYERWRKESAFVAVMMTFLLHSSFNLVGAIAMLLHR